MPCIINKKASVATPAVSSYNILLYNFVYLFIHTAMPLSFEYHAFEQALPILVDKLNRTFTATRDQCKAVNLLTEFQIKTLFGGHKVTHANETLMLLNIVLECIRDDPANFKKFRKLDVVKIVRGKCMTLTCHTRSDCKACSL